MTRPTTHQTHEAGEHAVMTELYERGVDAEQTGRNRKGIHLLTSTGKSLEARAKRRTTTMWTLPIERPDADLSILVSLGETHREDEFFVLPTGTLYGWAERDHHDYWSQRQDVTGETGTIMRLAPDERFEPYRDAWDMVVATGKDEGGGHKQVRSS